MIQSSNNSIKDYSGIFGKRPKCTKSHACFDKKTNIETGKSECYSTDGAKTCPRLTKFSKKADVSDAISASFGYNSALTKKLPAYKKSKSKGK